MRLAWPKLDHRFSVRQANEKVDGGIGASPTKIAIGHHCYSPKLLSISPVDLLVIERGYLKTPTLTYTREAWEDLVDHTQPDK
jgi:hypothetical protein